MADPNLMALYEGSLAETPDLDVLSQLYEDPTANTAGDFSTYQPPDNDYSFYDPYTGEPLSGRPVGDETATRSDKQKDMANMLALKAKERGEASSVFQNGVEKLNKASLPGGSSY